jgi:hypothetical protein
MITAFDNPVFLARVLLQRCVELDVFSTMAIFFAAPPLPDVNPSIPGRGLFFGFLETIVQYHKRPQF